MIAMSPSPVDLRGRCGAAARWLRQAYFPEPTEATAWTPPHGTWQRIRPTIDGLLILLLVTVPASFIGRVFAEGTQCDFSCQRGRFTAGGVIAAFLPLASSAILAAVTILEVIDGQRPRRWWILGLVLIGVWFGIGLHLMDSALR